MTLIRCTPCPVDDDLPRKILDYGNVRSYTTDDGDRITTLPTCTVPVEQLVPMNWKNPQFLKSNRDVRKISTLIDASHVQLFAKSFEQPCVSYEVFDQLSWESIFLLELIRNGFRTEIPQALVQGKLIYDQHLIVQEIADGTAKKLAGVFRGETFVDPRPERDRILADVQVKTTLELGDDAHHNFLTDIDGREWIIDVIRWGFRPFRKRLEELLREKSDTKMGK